MGKKMGKPEREEQKKKFRGKVVFAGTTYPTMDSLKAVFKALIVKTKNDAVVEGSGKDQLLELLKYHEKAEDKLKGLKDFSVGIHPEYNQTRCFFVIKEDGSKEDFSFHKCLTRLAETLEKNGK
jgi:DNA-directed RNA polymerase IV subunit 1